MKEYNKEKLHEYAKLLLKLSFEKGLFFDYNPDSEKISIYTAAIKSFEIIGYCYITEALCFYSNKENCVTIFELIERVRKL